MSEQLRWTPRNFLLRASASEPAHVARATTRRYATLCLLSVTGFMTGCFSYVSIDPRTVAATEDVRVVLDRPASSRVLQEYGLAGDRLMGRLTSITTDSMYVAAWVGDAFAGTQFATARQTIPLRRTEVLEVQRRRLSKARTALAIGAALGGVSILVARLAQSDNPGDDDGTEPPPPPPPEFLGIRFRLGFPGLGSAK